MLMTPWGEHLDENCILTEYPRPQMRRDSYLNLNGRWEYAITDSDELPRRWDGTILVPFSPESALSGVGRSLQPGQTLWYRREVILPQGFIPADGRLLLHFGAVDQEAAVYWNGRLLGRHMGGYNAFTLTRRMRSARATASWCAYMMIRTRASTAGESRKPDAAGSGIRHKAASGRRCGWRLCPGTISRVCASCRCLTSRRWR